MSLFHRTAAGLIFTAALTIDSSSAQEEFRSTAVDRELVSLTVYNANFGLVREIRSLTLGEGLVRLEYGDVAAGIQTETVNVRSLDGDLQVLEQNYQYDLLNPQKLLEKYVGRTVKMYRTNATTGQEEEFEAEVLSVNQGVVLRIDDEITYDVPARFAFPEIPDNLIAQPTLVWLLQTEREQQRIEVSYLTSNISWRADYVMVVNEDDTEGSLTGWITLDNRSGASFPSARLQLVAGDVRRVSAEDPNVRRDVMMRAVQAEGGFAEEGLFEYHLYTLQRATDLLDNEQKQVTLLEGEGIALEKHYTFQGTVPFFRTMVDRPLPQQRVHVDLEFANTAGNNLGMPLPRGVVRVYKADRAGAQQFVGEDRIDHTPRDETVRVRLGDAFDIVGDRRQIDFNAGGRCSSESAWEVELRNRKDDDVQIEVVEPAGGEWEIVSSSHEYRQIDAGTFAFDIDVPARSEVAVTYRVRVRWC
jgi:hypothetical protein